jgi:hypothetical protein
MNYPLFKYTDITRVWSPAKWDHPKKNYLVAKKSNLGAERDIYCTTLCEGSKKEACAYTASCFYSSKAEIKNWPWPQQQEEERNFTLPRVGQGAGCLLEAFACLYPPQATPALRFFI